MRKNRMRKFAFCENRISRKFACEKSHFAKNSHAKIRILRKIALCENSQNFASLRKIFLRFFAFASLRKMILKFFRIRIASHFYIQCEGTSLVLRTVISVAFDVVISISVAASFQNVYFNIRNILTARNRQFHIPTQPSSDDKLVKMLLYTGRNRSIHLQRLQGVGDLDFQNRTRKNKRKFS